MSENNKIKRKTAKLVYPDYSLFFRFYPNHPLLSKIFHRRLYHNLSKIATYEKRAEAENRVVETPCGLPHGSQ